MQMDEKMLIKLRCKILKQVHFARYLLVTRFYLSLYFAKHMYLCTHVVGVCRTLANYAFNSNLIIAQTRPYR